MNLVRINFPPDNQFGLNDDKCLWALDLVFL
jgi:hypothetical protein